MIPSRSLALVTVCLAVLAPSLPVVAAPAATAPPAWVQRSNEHAKVMLQLLARFTPEGAGELGVDGFDDQVTDLQPRLSERTQAAGRAAAAELRKRLSAERDPIVKQDLEILIDAADDTVRGAQLGDKYDLPFFHVPEIVFSGIHALLDEQIAPARRARALVRLRRYAGVEPGSTPITELAKARFRERLGVPSLLGPPRGDVERELAEASFYIDGVEKLLAKYKLSDAATMKKLRAQLDGYQAFVRAEVMPRARSDFRLPPEEYAFSLKQVGVDIPPAQLAQQAHAAFIDLQQKMQALAPQVAKQKGWSATDYRDVIRQLKKEQLVGEAILPHYQKRLGDLEEIIRAHHLLTLPARAARVRLATEAESAQVPAPNMHAPRLIGNRGEMGEFLLPLRIPSKDGKTQQFDDFTFAAASWTLTAHEARPGHELQFASIIEKGVSIARAVFAFNCDQRRGLGPVRGVDRLSVHAARGAAGVAAAPHDAGGARVPRPRAAGRQDHAGRGQAAAHARRRALGGARQRGGRALHLPLAGAGDQLLLRLHAPRRAARRRGEGARGPLRRAALPRLHPERGAPAAAGAAQGGDERLRAQHTQDAIAHRSAISMPVSDVRASSREQSQATILEPIEFR